jgi:hypothetical protein
MLNLFKKNKKKDFKAVCDLSRQPLEKASSYLLTTAELISSKKFWDNKMTEPDTMTYTVAHFKNSDPTAMNIRKMIFEKYSKEDKTWVISDSEIHLFDDVDLERSKKDADQWWENEGDYVPEGHEQSLQKLGNDTLEEIKSYAIMEAGRKQVPA